MLANNEFDLYYPYPEANCCTQLNVIQPGLSQYDLPVVSSGWGNLLGAHDQCHHQRPGWAYGLQQKKEKREVSLGFNYSQVPLGFEELNYFHKFLFKVSKTYKLLIGVATVIPAIKWLWNSRCQLK